jgi:hypothetical protein
MRLGVGVLASPFVALVMALAATPFACGNLGEAAFEGDDGSVVFPPVPTTTSSTAPDVVDSGPPLVLLQGQVVVARLSQDAGLSEDAGDSGSDGGPADSGDSGDSGSPLDSGDSGIPGDSQGPSDSGIPETGEPPAALIAIERGGLYVEPAFAKLPDGGPRPTIAVDPFYAYGTITNAHGAFRLEVPDEKLGIHVYSSGYYCGVPAAGAIEPGSGRVTIALQPLVGAGGGKPPAQPRITGFTANPTVVLPGESIAMTATVEAQDPDSDPLSEQVLAIEPKAGWAGAFAPTTAGTWGKGYPNGVYNRLVVAPEAPGEYTYYLVAATEACIVSEAAVAHVLVSLTGEGGIDDDEAGP